MRGTPVPQRVSTCSHGIIPAYAGNTLFGLSPSRSAWDHPRVCGEHVGTRRQLFRREGSSPRMRGTLNRLWPQLNVWGIIPAYAGNTCWWSACLQAAGDHPRVCGEHNPTVESATGSTGSSPRMRGTRSGLVRGSVPSGIIPAYAGNTLPPGATRRQSWDHPRVCGEHLVSARVRM